MDADEAVETLRDGVERYESDYVTVPRNAIRVLLNERSPGCPSVGPVSPASRRSLWGRRRLVAVAGVALVFVACSGPGESPTVAMPAEVVEAGAAPPGPGEPGWDVLDFVVGEEVQTELPTYWIEPGRRWVLCKPGFRVFGLGGCTSHEAWSTDGEWLYLDEDHSMNGGRPWLVYGPGGPHRMRMMSRRAVPGDRIEESICLDWRNHGTCDVWANCHAFDYSVEVVEFVRGWDFEGDVGVRDALVWRYLDNELFVQARGVGLVYWHDARTVARDRNYDGNWRTGPYTSEARPGVNPMTADTCVWR